jgi:gliding motility-associated lipoprotein GldD
MRIKRVTKYLAAASFFCILSGCGNDAVPKPRGYFRIDFPPREYQLYQSDCPFIFEYPAYSSISYDTGKKSEPCWFNIEFPRYRAKIYISYITISGNLPAILQESHEFAYSHSIKADAITEQPWLNPDKNVYGMLYDIKGNTASSVQFYVTDSTKNFLRGALYFAVTPSEDSLGPVIRHFREDIVHLIETLKWKDN